MHALTIRRAATAAALALVVTGLGQTAPGQAAPSLNEVRTPLAKGTADTDVVAASGTSIVTWVDNGGYRLSTDNGKTWQDLVLPVGESDFWARPDYVAAKTALWVQEAKVYSLDMASGAVSTVDLSGLELSRDGYERVIEAVTPSHALVYKDDAPQVLTFPGNAMAPVTEEAFPAEPAKTDETSTWWQLDSHRAYRIARYIEYLEDWDATLATDLDPVALDGTAGLAPIRVPGEVLSLVGGADSARYLVRAAGKVQDCTQALASPLPKPRCTTLATAKASAYVEGSIVRGVALFRVGRTWYATEGGKTRKLALPKGTSGSWWGVGDPERPLLAVGANISKSPVYQVDKAGKLRKLFSPLEAPKVPWELSLSADRVTGRDGRTEKSTGWVRSITTDGIGKETVLSTRASEVLTSAGRYAVNSKDGLVFYDRTKKTTTKAVESLRSLSGPYPAVRFKDKDYLGVPLTSYKRLADYPEATFGTRVLSIVDVGDQWAAGLKVVDVTDPTFTKVIPVPPDSGDEPAFMDAALWGNRITAIVEAYDTENGYTDALWTYDLTSGTWRRLIADEAELLGMGNGFVAASIWSDEEETSRLVVHALDSDASTVITDSSDEAVGVDADRIAYATDSELVVRSFADLAAEAPRVLGTIAASGCNAWDCAWAPQIDTSNALAGGSLLIKDAAGAVVRTVEVPASSDGSIRGVAWDGKLDDKSFAQPGTYTWLLQVTAVGGAAVKALDGTSDPSGKLIVTRKAVGKVKFGKISLSTTKPKVGSIVTGTVASVFPKDAALTYTWYAGSAKRLTAADATSYEVTAADVGKKLKLVVTGSREGATTASGSSAATKAVAKGVFTAKPVGTITADTDGLTVAEGEWAPVPDSFGYQWYSISATGKATAIAGATAKTYAAPAAAGTFQVKVTAKKAGYTDASVLSEKFTVEP